MGKLTKLHLVVGIPAFGVLLLIGLGANVASAEPVPTGTVPTDTSTPTVTLPTDTLPTVILTTDPTTATSSSPPPTSTAPTSTGPATTSTAPSTSTTSSTTAPSTTSNPTTQGTTANDIVAAEPHPDPDHDHRPERRCPNDLAGLLGTAAGSRALPGCRRGWSRQVRPGDDRCRLSWWGVEHRASKQQRPGHARKSRDRGPRQRTRSDSDPDRDSARRRRTDRPHLRLHALVRRAPLTRSSISARRQARSALRRCRIPGGRRLHRICMLAGLRICLGALVGGRFAFPPRC